jgi:hypothetical protein
MAHRGQTPQPPVLFRQRDRPLQQSLVRGVGDTPHPQVARRALIEGRMLGAEAVQHQLSALVHHGEFDRVPVPD